MWFLSKALVVIAVLWTVGWTIEVAMALSVGSFDSRRFGMTIIMVALWGGAVWCRRRRRRNQVARMEQEAQQGQEAG